MEEDTFDSKLVAKITEEDGEDLAASRPATPESRTATPDVPENPREQLRQEALSPQTPSVHAGTNTIGSMKKKNRNEKLEVADQPMKESAKTYTGKDGKERKISAIKKAVNEHIPSMSAIPWTLLQANQLVNEIRNDGCAPITIDLITKYPEATLL